MYDLCICNRNHPSGRPAALFGSRESDAGLDRAKLTFDRCLVVPVSQHLWLAPPKSSCIPIVMSCRQDSIATAARLHVPAR